MAGTKAAISIETSRNVLFPRGSCAHPFLPRSWGRCCVPTTTIPGDDLPTLSEI